ncbi:MAG TPA: aminotransferase class I/II-fold pyridoxal phosphate-dependent enzyme [Jatrophihabitans sp.]|nr:aminotransferase class I/II-fold pyridoxal phosphate-dependent enzyme [Jatrophihabitans sp.]
MTVTAAEQLEVLRRRSSDKWRRYPDDVLPMFVAEMDFPLAPAIKAALHEAVELGDTGYINARDTAAREAFADYAATSWGWRPSVERMGVTTDVSVVIVESLRRLIAPGDGVVIMPPVYPPFFDLLPEAGAVVVEVPMLDTGDRYQLDLVGIDRALAGGARGVLLCQPHNPLGHLHPRDELTELSLIVDRHGGFVVSDEIHGPLTHHGQEFVPYLTVSDQARDHSIAAESGSKAFNLAGLKTAFFVAEGDRMTALIRALPEEVTFRTGLFGLLATRAGFAESRQWLDATVGAIEANVELLEDRLRSTLPMVRFRRPAASYLAWLDMSSLDWGKDPAEVALREARVALSSGLAFGAVASGYARMNIACAPDVIVEAVERIAQVVQG